MAICICSEMMLSSAMLSCKSLSSESVSQTISIITLVLARISSLSENNSLAALMNNFFNSSSLMCGVLHFSYIISVIATCDFINIHIFVSLFCVGITGKGIHNMSQTSKGTKKAHKKKAV